MDKLEKEWFYLVSQMISSLLNVLTDKYCLLAFSPNAFPRQSRTCLSRIRSAQYVMMAKGRIRMPSSSATVVIWQSIKVGLSSTSQCCRSHSC